MSPLRHRIGLPLAALGMSCIVAPALTAQSVVLRLHPRVGDTLHTRLEQKTEVSGELAGGKGGAMKPVSSSIALNSRTIVQRSTAANTLVLTIVDSADIQTSDSHAATQVADAERLMRGQQMILQLAADGTVESATDSRGRVLTDGVARSMASMPAVFPQKAVSVGEQWMREMPLPAGGPLGARGSGHVIAAFRLDSLGRGGDIAYVSMQGDIRPDSTSQGVELSGTVSGSMQIDRTRGWLRESRFTVLLRSFVKPPVASGLSPMRFLTRVTQRLRTMDRR
jgi:hypothetical protein